MALKAPTKKPITLPPVHPNAGIEAEFRRRLQKWVDAMHKSVLYWIRAAYRANKPAMAKDGSAAAELSLTMKRLAAQWQKNINAASEEIADYFATAAAKRSDSALRAALAKAGFTVEFTMTREANDVMQATIGEQVGLIRTIASQYLSQVEGLVMRSVQEGRDLKGLTDDLYDRYRITRKRAAFIARDQNNKATASMTRVRQEALGITHAIWRHSHAAKQPRPEHLLFDGERYDVRKGAYLEGVWTWPGREINCGCTSQSIIPGF